MMIQDHPILMLQHGRSVIPMKNNEVKGAMGYSTQDYGWLSPDGTFYGVPWGEHQDWANQHVKDTKIYESLSLKERICADGFGDVLMNRGWILLHSPKHSIAQPTKKEEVRYTKVQMEFLFDYYLERGLKKEAYRIVNERDL